MDQASASRSQCRPRAAEVGHARARRRRGPRACRRACPDKSAGAEAAGRWLALADAGNGEATWHAAGAVFQAAVSQKDWTAALDQARTPYGALTRRTLADARATRTLPGAPEGDYVVLQYQSSFANRPTVTETVIVMRETDGNWKTITYVIR